MSDGDQFSARWAGTQGFRHRGQTNVAFCDGHAESLGTRYTTTYPADQPQIVPGRDSCRRIIRFIASRATGSFADREIGSPASRRRRGPRHAWPARWSRLARRAGLCRRRGGRAVLA